MIEPKTLWIILTFLLLLVCVLGQQRSDGFTGFIPRTNQNAKRVHQRLTAIERIKYNMKEMGITNMKANGMRSNNMGSSGRRTNRMNKGTILSGSMGSSGMGSNGMGSNGNGIGSNGNGMGSNGNGMVSNRNAGQSMSHGAFSYNAPSHMNNGGMMSGYIHPEQMEVIADLGGMGMMPGNMMGNSGMTIINVEAMENGAMGMMHRGGMRNNGRRGRRGRRRKMKIPLCQSFMECAERFIPPQCRSWRYDTVNNIMCRKCPINRCEGGAAEYFSTMYEYHPSRLMINMMQ